MRLILALCLLGPLVCDRVAAAAAPRDAPASGARLVAARLAEARQYRTRLGLLPEYEAVADVASLKIAVLDYGFAGAGTDRPYLPASAVVVEHYDPAFLARHADLGDPGFRKEFEPGNRHGRAMAQIVWAVTGSDPRGPQFYLLNASGPTMLRRAVRFAVEQRVDIILFSGSFEGGGNGDGRGPINRIASEALAAGIIWINAAGNHGGQIHSGPVRVLNEGYLRLGAGTDIAALRFRNRLDENAVTVTLTWNDYRETEDAGTTKDLDLYVEDWTGRRVGSSELVQVSGEREPGPGETRNPRERILLTDLPASPYVANDPDCAYRIRVRAMSGSFTNTDRLRVLVTAARPFYVPPGGTTPIDAVEFLDATREGELYPPADHPLVLTIGAADSTSSVGPTEDRRVKPDVILEDSQAFFTDGTLTDGSSNAAALFAGIVAVLKAAEPGLTSHHLLRLAQQGGSPRQIQVRTQTQTQTQATQPTTPRVTRVGTTASPPPPPRPVHAADRTTPDLSLPGHLERRLWKTPTRAELAEAVRVSR